METVYLHQCYLHQLFWQIVSSVAMTLLQAFCFIVDIYSISITAGETSFDCRRTTTSSLQRTAFNISQKQQLNTRCHNRKAKKIVWLFIPCNWYSQFCLRTKEEGNEEMRCLTAKHNHQRTCLSAVTSHLFTTRAGLCSHYSALETQRGIVLLQL